MAVNKAQVGTINDSPCGGLKVTGAWRMAPFSARLIKCTPLRGGVELNLGPGVSSSPQELVLSKLMLKTDDPDSRRMLGSIKHLDNCSHIFNTLGKATIIHLVNFATFS